MNINSMPSNEIPAIRSHFRGRANAAELRRIAAIRNDEEPIIRIPHQSTFAPENLTALGQRCVSAATKASTEHARDTCRTVRPGRERRPGRAASNGSTPQQLLLNSAIIPQTKSYVFFPLSGVTLPIGLVANPGVLAQTAPSWLNDA